MTVTTHTSDMAEPLSGGTGLAPTNDPLVPATQKTRSVMVYLSFAWLALVVFLALFASLLPIGSYEVPIGRPRQPPQLGSIEMLLGTDQLGRSVLARLVYGARVSLLVGTVSGIAGFTIGTTLGMIGGYFGRKIDAVITIVTDALLAFPALILLLALSSILTPSLQTMMIGLTLIVVPTFVRLSRATTIAWNSREFIRAARNMGAGNTRIIARELLPNVLPPIATYLPIVIAALIVAEGSLSFLGLGIPPPTPSWGGMIASGKDVIANYPALVFIPAGVIFLTVFSLNQAGDFLRVRLDRTMQD